MPYTFLDDPGFKEARDAYKELKRQKLEIEAKVKEAAQRMAKIVDNK